MKSFKEQFPIFKNYETLVYLDNAATTQKPKAVIDKIVSFYENSNANVHRGLYKLAEDASEKYELARKTVANFINSNEKEIIFTSGATHGVQLFVQSLISSKLLKDIKILASPFEHNSTLLPLKNIINGKIDLLNINENFEVEYDLINKEYDLVVIPHISNVTGTIVDPKKIREKVGNDAIIILDATQSVGHMKIDVEDLNIDAMVFSGHKMYGPQGVGVLYVNEKLLDNLNPNFAGGGTVKNIEFVNQSLNISMKDTIERFESGTPNVAGSVGLKAAIDWIEDTTFLTISKIETELKNYFLEQIKQFDDIKIFHPVGKDAGSVVSFVHDKVHSHDLAQYLGDNDICVRAGHHCAHLFHKGQNINSSIRVSFGVYNTKKDIDSFINVISEAIKYYVR